MASKLTPKLARDLADADATVAARKLALVAAEEIRERLRARARDVLAPGESQTTGGVTVKLTVSERESFSLAAYRQAGYKVTQAMAKHVSRSQVERWTVKRIRPLGP